MGCMVDLAPSIMRVARLKRATHSVRAALPASEPLTVSVCTGSYCAPTHTVGRRTLLGEAVAARPGRDPGDERTMCTAEAKANTAKSHSLARAVETVDLGTSGHIKGLD